MALVVKERISNNVKYLTLEKRTYSDGTVKYVATVRVKLNGENLASSMTFSRLTAAAACPSGAHCWPVGSGILAAAS